MLPTNLSSSSLVSQYLFPPLHSFFKALTRHLLILDKWKPLTSIDIVFGLRNLPAAPTHAFMACLWRLSWNFCPVFPEVLTVNVVFCRPRFAKEKNINKSSSPQIQIRKDPFSLDGKVALGLKPGAGFYRPVGGSFWLPAWLPLGTLASYSPRCRASRGPVEDVFVRAFVSVSSHGFHEFGENVVCLCVFYHDVGHCCLNVWVTRHNVCLSNFNVYVFTRGVYVSRSSVENWTSQLIFSGGQQKKTRPSDTSLRKVRKVVLHIKIDDSAEDTRCTEGQT